MINYNVTVFFRVMRPLLTSLENREKLEVVLTITFAYDACAVLKFLNHGSNESCP